LGDNSRSTNPTHVWLHGPVSVHTTCNRRPPASFVVCQSVGSGGGQFSRGTRSLTSLTRLRPGPHFLTHRIGRSYACPPTSTNTDLSRRSQRIILYIIYIYINTHVRSRKPAHVARIGRQGHIPLAPTRWVIAYGRGVTASRACGDTNARGLLTTNRAWDISWTRQSRRDRRNIANQLIPERRLRRRSLWHQNSRATSPR
jgi:hypothetical protein